MTDSETEKFFDEHCASPGGVVLAHVYDEDGEAVMLGLFSTLGEAQEWADSRRVAHADETATCLFVPSIIDEPEYGNVSADRRH